MRNNHRFWIPLLLLLVLASLTWCLRQRSGVTTTPPKTETSSGSSRSAQPTSTTPSNVPSYVLDVLRYVRENGKAPSGYEGGRTFENREKRLPLRATDGARIRYQEWDVRAKVRSQNRGAERLVTGSNASAYYTKDHYRNFLQIE